MYLLGYDIGSSSVKACLVDANSGKIVASDFFPKQEMKITALKTGWAEQDPKEWWKNLKLAHQSVMSQSGAKADDVKAIGITWQMHGLVLVDKNQEVLRPSIIWCDSRAVNYGQNAFKAIGEERCLTHLLNSPGNFTASKLAWVRDNEPHIYEKIDKLMLPGDYIGMKLSGDIVMTVEGLSEGIFWDFKNNCLSEDVLNYYKIPKDFFPEIKPVFGEQGFVNAEAAKELGLKEGIPISYRAGDQPNNALSLGVFEPGEIAANAGTSGVVYGVLDHLNYDKYSRVNTFAHVNYSPEKIRLGVLLCINGTGILNSWMRKNLAVEGLSYNEMNKLAMESSIGANGVRIVPFGNGAERILENKDINCSIHGINFNIHDKKDLLRAAQEGIVFSYQYGIEIMQEMGMEIKTVKAGYANMFLSPLFAQTLANVSDATIKLYNTDGAAGAAKGAGYGIGLYSSLKEAFASLELLSVVEPQKETAKEYADIYAEWKKLLQNN